MSLVTVSYESQDTDRVFRSADDAERYARNQVNYQPVLFLDADDDLFVFVSYAGVVRVFTHRLWANPAINFPLRLAPPGYSFTVTQEAHDDA